MGTAELMRRLRTHLLPPTDMLPGGVLLEEVGENGVSGAQRVDAVHVGFTSSSGRILQGFELKTSLGDWRRELGNSHKADRWADACHAFWLVTNGTDVINPDETPPGWGYMTPENHSTTRMRIVVPAAVKQDFTPPWWAVRSCLARLDTMRAQQVRDQVGALLARARADAVEEYERYRRSMEALW